MKTRTAAVERQRGSLGPPAGARRSGGAIGPIPGGSADIARAGPVVADRPDQPQPDEHRHEQAQDGDLVRAVPERVEEQEDDQPVQQLADDLAALADQPVDPEELADPVGRREADHQHAVGDLDAAQTAARGSPRRRGTGPARPARTPIATPPTRSPTAHDRRTQTSVRFGPCRSHSQPHTKLIAMATRVSDSRTSTVSRSDSPNDLGRHDAHDDDDRVDRIGVEEPPEQEPAETRHLARVRDRAPELTERVADVGRRHRLRAGDPRLADERGRSGSRRAGTGSPSAGIDRRPGRRGRRSAARRRPCRSSRSRSRAPTACRASPGS